MNKTRKKLAGVAQEQGAAIPQLIRQELDEMMWFLHWLLAEPENSNSRTFSMMVYILAAALERVGVHINTQGPRAYETQPLVHYAEPGANSALKPVWYYNSDDPQNVRRTIQLCAQQISYPCSTLEAMIETLPLSGDARNDLEMP